MDFEIIRNKSERTFGGKTITVREVTVEEIFSIFNATQETEEKKASDPKKEQDEKQQEEQQQQQQSLIDQFEKIIMLCTENVVDKKALIKMPPSQIRKLLEYIEHVNQDFFWMLGLVGLTKEEVKKEISMITKSYMRQIFLIQSTA